MVKKKQRELIVYCPKIADIIKKSAHIEVILNTYEKNYKPIREFHTHSLFIGSGRSITKVCLPAAISWIDACAAYPELAQYQVQKMPCVFKKHFDEYIVGEFETTPKIYH